MPFLFLSPSTQRANLYVTSESERYWMNLLADEMEPYLHSSGVNFTRNDPNATAAQAIRDSNAGFYDFHLALHSNAASDAASGTVRGIDVYYFPTSVQGLRMANILVDNLREVYPLPASVRALPTTSIGEVRLTTAPSVLVELGYHDNILDAQWIENNLPQIAVALVLSVTEFLGLPFIPPNTPRTGIVRVSSSALNLRAYPTTNSDILTQIPNGAVITIYGTYDGWYSAEYNGLVGFVSQQFVSIPT